MSKNTKGMNNRSTIVIAILLSLTAVYFARDIVNNFLLALFIVIIMGRPQQFLVEKKVTHGLAAGIMILVLILTYFGFMTLIGSSISMFVERAPEYGENLKIRFQSLSSFMGAYGLSFDGSSEVLDPSKIMSYTANLFSGLSSTLRSELTLILLSIFLISESNVFKLKVKSIVESSSKSFEYLTVIVKSIRHYLSIKTITSLLTGIIIGIGLAIIGVDFPILWGLVAFLLNYIPNIGSLIAALPAIALSFVQFGGSGMIWTSILYLVVNLVIGTVLEPRIMGKGLGLSTFIVFAGLIVWGFLLGPNGMFLSVPITITLKIILEQRESTKAIAMFFGTKNDIERQKSN